jgi:hypothetical protein
MRDEAYRGLAASLDEIPSGCPRPERVEAHRIRLDAGIVIANRRGSHAVVVEGVIVLEGDRIVHVGREADGPVDETLDLRDGLVTPWVNNTHTHLSGARLDTRCSRTLASTRSSTPRWRAARSSPGRRRRILPPRQYAAEALGARGASRGFNTPS